MGSRSGWPRSEMCGAKDMGTLGRPCKQGRERDTLGRPRLIFRPRVYFLEALESQNEERNDDDVSCQLGGLASVGPGRKRRSHHVLYHLSLGREHSIMQSSTPLKITWSFCCCRRRACCTSCPACSSWATGAGRRTGPCSNAGPKWGGRIRFYSADLTLNCLCT